jgi:histidyl-tRNA synthetase
MESKSILEHAHKINEPRPMAKSDRINFSCPSGFPEFLPAEKRLEQHLLDTIRSVYERYGFTPIETPVVERLEVLQAKGNQGDNIVYGISPILPPNRQMEKDQADRKDQSQASTEASADGSTEARALKFDQTVPLAAYIARHLNDLTFPFARYQMDMVFRGERAKDGRFRQFRQCDIDVIGRGELSLLYDAQMPAIIAEIFDAINIGDFLIRINNRKVLTGFFSAIALSPQAITPCIRIVDEAEKIGVAGVTKKLAAMDLSADQIQQILSFTQITGSVDQILEQLRSLATQTPNETFSLGIDELQTVVAGIRSLGVPDNRYCIDLAIARGLDYYTGTVYETTLIGHEALGSICSGGRYDELVSMFLGDKLPGVGISIGLTRLMSRLLKAEILKPLAATPAEVFILNVQQDLMPTYLDLSQQLRKAGIKVLTSFEQKAFGKQFQAAEKRGIPLCLIVGSKELEAQKCNLKNLKTGEQIEVAIADLIPTIKSTIARLM